MTATHRELKCWVEHWEMHGIAIGDHNCRCGRCRWQRAWRGVRIARSSDSRLAIEAGISYDSRKQGVYRPSSFRIYHDKTKVRPVP